MVKQQTLVSPPVLFVMAKAAHTIVGASLRKHGWGRTGAGMAAALFLAWQSVALFRALTDIQPSSWILSAFTAGAFNMMVTGTFAFVGFVLPTYRLLPSGYYRVRRPKRLQRAYYMLRVECFRRVLLATLWKDRTKRHRFFDGSASGLAHLSRTSQAAEFGHTIPFVLLTAAGLWWTLDGSVRLGLLTIAFNVLGNLYPVLLQRHHRMRIQRLRLRYGT